MNISLDRNGRAVVSGEGTFRRPEGVGQTDVMMNSPAVIAEMLQERESAQTLAANRVMDNTQAYQNALDDQRNYEESLALDYENYQREARAEAYGGEDPLAYIAALQTMAGAVADYHMPLGGYALSSDGTPQYHRQISGHAPMHGHMGSWLDDLTSNIADVTSNVSDIASSVEDMIPGGDEPVAAPRQVVVTRAPAAAPSAGMTKFMKSKIGPVPYWAIATALLGSAAFVIIRRKR